MKFFKLIITCFIILLPLFEAMAQDVHFSQFAMSPLLLNPALAGMSQGNYRVYANFRTQWNTVAGGAAYRTFAGGGDMVLGKVTRYSSYAGIGVSFFSDQAGAAGFQSNRLALTFAYHLVMGRSGNSSLSFGINGAFNHSGFDPGKAIYDFNYDQSTGTINHNQSETFTRTKVFYGDVSAGAFYNVNLRSGTDLYIGAGLSHINQPKISFNPGGTSKYDERLDMKFTTHGGATVKVREQFWIIPNYFIMVQGGARQYNAGMLAKVQVGNRVLSHTFLYFGAQVRMAHALIVPMTDAMVIHARLDYKGFTAGMSYDVNVSKLTSSSSTFGAPELSIMYTIASKYKPRPGYCPVML